MTAPRVLAFNDLENAYDDPERIGRLAGLIDDRRDERTIVCGAGDDTALGTVALLTGKRRGLARAFFEAVEPAAETFGNHDFDLGREWAVRWASSVPPTYCCANLEGPGVEEIPSATRLEAGGQQVGITGVAHPDTADVCGSIDDLVFENPVPAVRRCRKRLGSDGVDAVVVLSHCGGYDREIAAETDVDAVIGGHVHREQCERVAGTAFVRTAGGGSELAEVALGDPPTVRLHDASRASVNERIVRTYREYRAETRVEQPLADVSERLTRTDGDRFGGESRTGNFLADAVRKVAGADLALFPAGSLRTGPPLEGTVTVGDVVSLAPFEDSVREVDVSGAGLRTALDGAAVPHPGDRGWVHAHLSGGRARWNTDGALVRLSVDGEPVADDRAYAVATTGWLVEVNDLFDPIAPDRVVADHAPIYEAAIAHARDGGLERARCEGRIRKAGASDGHGT